MFVLNSLNSCCCLHLGNKCDLKQERQVQFEEACNFAKNEGILAALETSAKVMSVHIKHGGEVLKLIKIAISSSLSPSLCLGESERGRSLHDDGQRAAGSQRP